MNLDSLLGDLRRRRKTKLAKGDRRARRKNRKRVQALEQLEARQLLAADESVLGSAFAGDTIVVRQVGSNIEVSGVPTGLLGLGGIGTQTFPVPTDSLTIDGGAFNDKVTIEGTIDLGNAKLKIIAEEIVVSATAEIAAGDIELLAQGDEAALSIASNLPVDVADFLTGDRRIVVEDGANIAATGDVTLAASRVASLASPLRPFGLGSKNATIDIDAATISGNEVTITADARDENLTDELPDFAQNWVLPALPLIDDALGGVLPNVPFSVMIREGSTNIDLAGATITGISDVNIAATTETDSSTEATASRTVCLLYTSPSPRD